MRTQSCDEEISSGKVRFAPGVYVDGSTGAFNQALSGPAQCNTLFTMAAMCRSALRIPIHYIATVIEEYIRLISYAYIHTYSQH